ncbi:MAG: phage shock protein operon transcriptional activator [Aeromonas sp.]
MAVVDKTVLIGDSSAFLAVLEQVSQLAKLQRPVLILGERGTGKELIAHRLHYLSTRWAAPFISLNCATLGEELVASELFGHEQGAFTGAAKQHAGRFERAEGGSLFLDEVATLRPMVQQQLLRVIEYGEFERVGGRAPLTADVRLICATHSDLAELAERGEFRADLLDRLAFDVVWLPPLRARREDILPLAEFFAQKMAAELGWPLFAGFSPAAQAALLAHPWPGNVRELKNVVERSVYRAERARDQGACLEHLIFNPFLPTAPALSAPAVSAQLSAQIAAQTLAQAAPVAVERVDFKAAISQLEQQLVAAALVRCGGHQRQAAAQLLLSYDQFRGLMRKYPLLKDTNTHS